MVKGKYENSSLHLVPSLEIKDYTTKRYSHISSFFNDVDGKMLDVGCYRGELRHHISKALNYHGIDIKDNNFSNYIRFNLNAKKLPFKDCVFDAIACCATLEHLFYPMEIMLELRRLLTPGGIVLVSLPNDRGINSIVRSIFSEVEPYEKNIYGHHWRFSIKTARDFFKKAFTLIKEEPFYGPLFQKYIPFLKIKPICTEIFFYGIK